MENTWFIIYDENKNVSSYGDIGFDQVVEEKWSEVHYYSSEVEWANALDRDNIDPYKVEDE